MSYKRVVPLGWMKPIDEKDIIGLYCVDMWSLQKIADKYECAYTKIKKILKKYNIKILPDGKGRKRDEKEKKEMSIIAKQSHKCRKEKIKYKAMPKRTKHIPNRKMPKWSLYRNMANHLKYEIEEEWLLKFEDIEKLKLLNKLQHGLTKHGESFETKNKYKEYIEKFYYDEQFTNVYNNWIRLGKMDYAKPSIDHIIPKSKGGTCDLENLQIIPWFINRAKNNLSIEDWAKVRKEFINDKYAKY